MESENDLIHGADRLRAYIGDLSPGTEIDVDDLARRFGLTQGYVYDLLHQLINVSVWHPGRGEFVRMASGLEEIKPPGEVWRSVHPDEFTPDRPGASRHYKHKPPAQ